MARPDVLLLGTLLWLGLSTVTASSDDQDEKPVICFDGQPHCLNCEATCHGTQCQCDTGFGHGYLACHKENQRFCHIINDPVAWTFGKEDFDLPLPCRFLATHVTSHQMYQGWDILQCRTQVHAFNTRSLGKFFVGGADVMVEYMHPTYTQLHFKVTGHVSGEDDYHFELSMRDTFDDTTPFSSDFKEEDIDGALGEVEFHVDEKNKRAILRIPNCALEMIYRPAHPTKGLKQIRMPGLAIAYDTNYHLEWLELDHVMCLSPDPAVTSTGKVAADADMSPSEVFIWRASNHAPPQNMNYAGFTSTCNIVVNSVKDCTNNALHKEAIEMCAFIINRPLFVHCYSDHYNEEESTEGAMALFGQCIEAFCAKDSFMCRQVHQDINTAKCMKHAYDGFKEHQCAFNDFVPQE